MTQLTDDQILALDKYLEGYIHSRFDDPLLVGAISIVRDTAKKIRRKADAHNLA